MSAFVHFKDARELERAPWDWTDHEKTFRMVQPRIGATHEPLQAVRFAHPSRGVHFVYTDASKLDAGGLPGPAERNELAQMLERALAREGK